MPIASLAWCQFIARGAHLQVSYSLQSPFGLFFFPFPFLLAYGVAKGKCATENARTVPVSVEFLLLR